MFCFVIGLVLSSFICCFCPQGVSNLIHDSNKTVRVAFVKLLSLVKTGTAIKYYQVVPVDHILARLAEDHLK